MTRRIAFWIFVAVQAAIPLGMVGLQESRFAGAEEVLLRVQPIDPHDLFRGEYVRLSYGITRLQAPPGTVFVPLHRTGGSWTGSQAQTTRPSGGTFIQGRSNGAGTIDYGIESFYVQEGQARRYESALFGGGLYARVSLTDDGRARVEELVVR